MYENRRYTIFPVSELHKIDFTQVEETSAETVRKSIDDTKTFVKWEGEMPSCLNDVADKEGPYTHTEILSILDLPFWNKVFPRE